MQLNLLILWVVLSHAIIGIFSSENINESTDLLVRKKRVINMEPGGDEPVKAGEFSYVINIKLNNKPHCVGSILSRFTVITSAQCASQDISEYEILSGSIYINRGSVHRVIAKKIRSGNHPRARAFDGIALLTVNPSFTSRHTSIIRLHVEPLLAGTHATVAGWGRNYFPGVLGTKYARNLRSITVPIMAHRQCVDVYRDFYDINDEDVCIYDEYKHCGDTDSGAPLIIQGKLAGIYLRRADNHRNRPAPEIFVILQHFHYNQWIKDNIVH